MPCGRGQTATLRAPKPEDVAQSHGIQEIAAKAWQVPCGTPAQKNRSRGGGLGAHPDVGVRHRRPSR